MVLLPVSSPRPLVAVLCASPDQRPPCVSSLEAVADLRYTDASGLAGTIQHARALLVWESSSAVKDAWPHATALEWIHVAAAGVDKLLFPELVDSEVVVTNARGVFDRPIAEFVLGAVLAFAKDLHRSHDLQGRRAWEHRATLPVRGTTALVVGVGAIGREIARLLRAVGMEVRGVGRRCRQSDPDFGEIWASEQLVDRVGWADHVVIVAPLTEATRGLVGEEVLSAMKPTAHLVNVGRGAIVDEHALAAALDRGTLAAASLDVFDEEPLPVDSPLWRSPGVAVTPHMSGDEVGSLDALGLQFTENAERWLRGDPLVNVVDKALGFVSSAPTEDVHG